MVGGIVEWIKLKWFVRAASEPSSMSRSRAIAVLGNWPVPDAALAILSRIVDAELGRTIYGGEALEALCRLRSDRVTGCLEHVLQSPRLHASDLDRVISTLLEVKGGDSIPALVDRARRECRGGGFPVWFEGVMSTIGTKEAERALDALVDDALKAGLDALAHEPPGAVIAEAVDGYLERRGGARAAQARPVLHRALIAYYLRLASQARDYDLVAQAVANLEGFEMPESRDALITFRNRPSRELVKKTRVPPKDGGEDGLVEPKFLTETIFSSAFGQPPGNEESEMLREAEEAARQSARAAQLEAEKERLRQVYSDLLVLGTSDDVAAYARNCLEKPSEAPGLYRLADYLADSKKNALAAQLARRIEHGDRSVLEAFLLGEGSMEAVRLLEQLRYPRLWETLLEAEKVNWTSGRRALREVTRPLCERYADEMSSALVRVLRDEETTSRRLPALAEALGWCGDIAVQRVWHLLSDPRWPVRRQAVGYLAQSRSEQARYALEEFLKIETDRELRLIAESGLKS